MISPQKRDVFYDEDTDQYKACGKWFDTWIEAYDYTEDAIDQWWESRYEMMRDERLERET